MQPPTRQENVVTEVKIVVSIHGYIKIQNHTHIDLNCFTNVQKASNRIPVSTWMASFLQVSWL